MYKNKKVLLIGGGGTLGSFTAEELLRKGAYVDVICLDDKESSDKLRFFKLDANLEALTEFLKGKHYDGIVNFIHYPKPDAYPPVHKLLTGVTEHLIFLSSYRVYAGNDTPITERTPQLIDVIKDDDTFLAEDDYGISKSKAERFLNTCEKKNFTVVRPVISFSKYRFDVVATSTDDVIKASKSGTPIYLPIDAKKLTAGLDYAYNTGKLIANLLFKPEALGEAFTVTSGQNLTWGEVADIYTELLGVKFIWIDTDEYVEKMGFQKHWSLKYDRLYDRKVDNSKILKVTGLNKNDFIPIKEGIKIELEKYFADQK